MLLGMDCEINWEIFCQQEEIRDLLAKDHKKRLELKERPDTGVYVKVSPQNRRMFQATLSPELRYQINLFFKIDNGIIKIYVNRMFIDYQ